MAEQLLQLVQGLDMWFVLPVIGIAVLILVMLWDKLPAGLSLPGVFKSDPDMGDVKALKRLRARAARIACKEFNDGLTVVAEHFFHQPGSHS